MVKVTVHYYLSGNTIHKSFDTEDLAKKYLIGLSGSFHGYLDNGTFGIYV